MNDTCTLEVHDFLTTEIFSLTPASTGDIKRNYLSEKISEINLFAILTRAYFACMENIQKPIGESQATWLKSIGELDEEILNLANPTYDLLANQEIDDDELLSFLVNNDFSLKMKPNREYKIKITIKNITKAKPNVTDLEFFK